MDLSEPSEGAVADPTPEDVAAARRRIADVVRRTPLRWSAALGVHLKLETDQETGSFKLRGAANKLRSLDDAALQRGVVTVSSGNHGRAVAYVAARLGVPATVCLTGRAPRLKVAAIADLGARVLEIGDSMDEADAEARRLEAEDGLTFVHPFDDPAVIAGQGTVGLEILDDLPDVERVIVPLSGGGLMSGIALAVKAARPDAHAIGVTMENGAAMHESLLAGRIVDVVEDDTLADALAGGLGPVNHHTLRMCARLVDETVLVTEDEIGAAMAFALDEEGLVVEGGAAVGIAAVMTDRARAGDGTVVVVSGRNVDPGELAEVVARHRG